MQVKAWSAVQGLGWRRPCIYIYILNLVHYFRILNTLCIYACINCKYVLHTHRLWLLTMARYTLPSGEGGTPWQYYSNCHPSIWSWAQGGLIPRQTGWLTASHNVTLILTAGPEKGRLQVGGAALVCEWWWDILLEFGHLKGPFDEYCGSSTDLQLVICRCCTTGVI